MAINKVIYDNTTLIDLTSDTVSTATLLNGITAHDKSGAIITGTIVDGNSLGYGTDRSAPIVGMGEADYMVLGDQDSPLVGTGQVGLMTI